MAIVSPPEGSRPAEAPLNPEDLADEASKRVEQIEAAVPPEPQNYTNWLPMQYKGRVNWYAQHRAIDMEETTKAVTAAKSLALAEGRKTTQSSVRIADTQSTLLAADDLVTQHGETALSHIANTLTTTDAEADALYADLQLAFSAYDEGYVEDGLRKFFADYLRACAKNDITKKQELENFLATECHGKHQQILAMFRDDAKLGESLYRMSFHQSEWEALAAQHTATNDNTWQQWSQERDDVRLSSFHTDSLMQRDEWVNARIGELAEENPTLSEAELRLQAQAEFHTNESATDFDFILNQLYAGSFNFSDLPPEEQERRIREANEGLMRVFASYAESGDPREGFITFYTQYNNALYVENDTETVERMEAQLASVLPPGESSYVLRALRSNEVQSQFFQMNVHDQLRRAAELDLVTLQTGGTPGLYARAVSELYNEQNTPSQRIANFRRLMREAAGGDARLQALVNVDAANERTVNIIRTLQLQERREGKIRSTRRDERVQTVQRIVSSPILSAIGSMRMPERAREAITAVAENPRAREIVSLMLRNGFTATDTQLQGSIAGADVMLHYGNPNEAPRFWIMGNQNNYTFDPSPEGYDTTRMQAMAAEGGSFAVREDESLANVIGLFLAREDLHDEQTMNQFTANKLENFMRLLCGRNADARDERDRLAALGIYRGGSNVSPMQIQRFAIALPHYFGEAGETNIDEEGALGFDAMVTLAQIWEEEGFRLPPANDLIRRTQERTNS